MCYALLRPNSRSKSRCDFSKPSSVKRTDLAFDFGSVMSPFSCRRLSTLNAGVILDKSDG